MRTISQLLIISILLSSTCMKQALAQTTELHIPAGSSVYISAGETFQVNKLALAPSEGFSLDKSILSSTALITNTTGVTQPYLGVVYAFSGTLTSFSGTITLNHAGASNSAGISAGAMKLHYHDGTKWNFDVNSSSTGSILTSTLSNKSLSELTVAGSALTLPVTWLSFTAEKQSAGAFLKWTTATELNTKYFVVQHSTNAVSWTALGTVMAAGNSNTARSYSFTHHTPFKENLYNYYRLLQRDLDGKFSYSKIASLIYDEPGANVMVYPNPATDILTIYLAETQEVRLVNVLGATIWKGALTAGRNQINLTRFAKGIYWVIAGAVKKQIIIQ